MRSSFSSRSLVVAVLLLLRACHVAAQCEGKVDSCDKDVDYFKDNKIEIKLATRTIKDLEFSNTYVSFSVVASDSSGAPSKEYKHRIYKCGCPTINQEEGLHFFFTNPSKVFVSEGPVLGFMDSLQLLGRIGYVGPRETIYNEDVLKDIEKGDIQTLAYGPDFIGNDYTPLKDDDDFSLAILGSSEQVVDMYDKEVPDKERLIISEQIEDDPLGRAEWMKIIGLLFERGREANNTFNTIVDNYNAIKDKTKDITRRPSVFFNYPYLRVKMYEPGSSADENYRWTQPNQDSYPAKLMEDAKADYAYMFRDEKGSYNIKLSEVERDFVAAEFLVQTGNSATGVTSSRTLDDFVNDPIVSTGDGANDESFKKLAKKLAATRCGKVYSNQKRVRDQASDYFESGAFQPDKVLQDYVKIFHPQIELPELHFSYALKGDPQDLTEAPCPYEDLTSVPAGKDLKNKPFFSPNLNRFGIEKKMFTNATVKKELRNALGGIDDDTFDIVFTEPAQEENAKFILRAQLDKDKGGDIEKDEVLAALQNTLSKTIRAEDPKPPNTGGNGPTDNGDGDDGGLGGGAIFGIILLVVVVIGIIVYIIWRRRRKARRQYPPPGMVTQDADPIDAGDNWAEI